jgi:hypothetical protein
MRSMLALTASSAVCGSHSTRAARRPRSVHPRRAACVPDDCRVRA